jgi:hypothetical protein
VQIQLGHDAGAVGRYGLDRDFERGGDFLVGLALRHQLHDLAFAGAELAGRPSRLWRLCCAGG